LSKTRDKEKAQEFPPGLGLLYSIYSLVLPFIERHAKPVTQKCNNGKYQDGVLSSNGHLKNKIP
jgi:hypothetical protein